MDGDEIASVWDVTWEMVSKIISNQTETGHISNQLRIDYLSPMAGDQRRSIVV